MDVDHASLKDFDLPDNVPVAPPSPPPDGTPENDDDDDEENEDVDEDDSSPDKGKEDDVYEEEIGKALQMAPLLKTERYHGMLLASSNKKRRRDEDPNYSDEKLESMTRVGLKQKGKGLKSQKKDVDEEFKKHRAIMDVCRAAMDNITEAPAYTFAVSKLKPSFDLLVKTFVTSTSMNLITVNVDNNEVCFPELVARMLTSTAILLRAPPQLLEIDYKLKNVVDMLEKKDDEEEELLVRRARVKAAKARSKLMSMASQDIDNFDFE